MAKRLQTMKAIDQELERIDSEIERLRIERNALKRLRDSLTSGSEEDASKPKRRASNVKPLVLGIMEQFGAAGGTSAEVTSKVQEHIPQVSRDSVSSILSRLKTDGALRYDGHRYYDARYGPTGDDGSDMTPPLRAVR